MSCARLPFRRTLAVTGCGRWSVFDCIGYIGYLGFPVSHSVSRMLHFCNWHLISKAAKLSIVFMHAALPLKVIPIVGTQSRLVETLGDPAHPRCSKLFTFPRTTWKGDWLPQNDNRIPVRSNGDWAQFTARPGIARSPTKSRSERTVRKDDLMLWRASHWQQLPMCVSVRVRLMKYLEHASCQPVKRPVSSCVAKGHVETDVPFFSSLRVCGSPLRAMESAKVC